MWESGARRCRGKASDVKTPADLKGKTLGITGLGSSTDFLTRYIVSPPYVAQIEEFLDHGGDVQLRLQA